ncbi:hypothetical protein LSAT2_008314 [Lamellibrachia satsuma]|nr:hypothetical protein LSAT2_008314 [Lamellibrachia satsuma]
MTLMTRHGSRVAGVVVGILFGVAIFGILIYCCCCRHKGNDGKTFVQRRFTQNGHPKQSERNPRTIPLTGPRMGVNYPQPGAQPPGPTVQPLFPVEPNPLNPQPYPSQPAYPLQPQPGYPPQPTYPTGGPPYPTAGVGSPYPPAGGGCPYPVNPPMTGENNGIVPNENNPLFPKGQEEGPGCVALAPVPSQPYGDNSSAPPLPVPATDGSYPQVAPPPYPGGH